MGKLVFSLYLLPWRLSKLGQIVSFTALSGQTEALSECSGKGVWGEEYETSTSFLLPNQVGAGGVALCALEVLSAQTDAQQSRCRTWVHPVSLQGAVL